ncbi:MAG: TlyA family RNA methyltransferase [Clostridia bacterium]|nr:TlyA family RNA methyltransferase [Clostridia bacterium]
MRADKYFSERYGSRTKAAEAIEKGLVLVNGKLIKPKTEISENDEIQFITPTENYVSNGGYKLARAIERFNFSCKDLIFADIGASTGGFTDCLLQNGAKKVYTVDVGESLLHESLCGDSRIVQMENTNARYLTKADFSDEIDGIVADVSFISLRLIFPVIKEILQNNGHAFVLIKPQFECENKHIGKSGIVATSAHADIVKKVLEYAEENGLYPHAIVNAPVRKGKNIEYVLYVRPTYVNAMDKQSVINAVKALVKDNSLGILQ